MKKILSICLFLTMAASMMCVLQASAQYPDFAPGEVIVALYEPYLGSSPKALFPELEIEGIRDSFGEMYESYRNFFYANEDAFEELRGRIGTLFLITLVDKSYEAILNAIKILEQNPNVRFAEPNYKVRHAGVHVPFAPLNLDTADTWAHGGITEAFNKGFIPFELQDSYTNVITRAGFCRMAVRWMEYATLKSIDDILYERGLYRNFYAFTDTNDPDILAAFALGITSGVGNNRFDPNGQFTREQAATMIMNVCRAIGVDIRDLPPSGFADMNNVSNWAVGGVNFVRANSIMQGTGGNNFTPRRTFTIQESIVTFNNINHGALLGR